MVEIPPHRSSGSWLNRHINTRRMWWKRHTPRWRNYHPYIDKYTINSKVIRRRRLTNRLHVQSTLAFKAQRGLRGNRNRPAPHCRQQTCEQGPTPVGRRHATAPVSQPDKAVNHVINASGRELPTSTLLRASLPGESNIAATQTSVTNERISNFSLVRPASA